MSRRLHCLTGFNINCTICKLKKQKINIGQFGNGANLQA